MRKIIGLIPVLAIVIGLGTASLVLAQPAEDPPPAAETAPEAAPAAETAPAAAPAPEATEPATAPEAAPDGDAAAVAKAVSADTGETAESDTEQVSSDDLGDIAKSLFGAIKDGKWALVAMLGLVLLVGGIRRAAKADRFAWLNWARSKWAGWGILFVGSAAGAIATAQLAGAELSLKLALPIIMVALSGSGLYELFSDVKGLKDE